MSGVAGVGNPDRTVLVLNRASGIGRKRNSLDPMPGIGRDVTGCDDAGIACLSPGIDRLGIIGSGCPGQRDIATRIDCGACSARRDTAKCSCTGCSDRSRIVDGNGSGCRDRVNAVGNITRCIDRP